MAAMLEQYQAQRDTSTAEAHPQAAGNTSTISAGSNTAEYHNSDSQPQPSGTVLRQCQVTMLETEQAVSLPEATLHQGEEPPAYAEAIGMKTVDLDQDDTSIGNQNHSTSSSLQDRDLTN
jgi:hypothetical protein